MASSWRRQRHHQQPVVAMRIGERPQIVIPLLDRLDVVHDQIELAVGEHPVNTAQSLHRLRTSEIRHDHADRHRPPQTQPARRRTRSEPHLRRHRADPLTRQLVDDVHAVHRPRSGGDADARTTCHVPNRYSLLHIPPCNRLHATGYSKLTGLSTGRQHDRHGRHPPVAVSPRSI